MRLLTETFESWPPVLELGGSPVSAPVALNGSRSALCFGEGDKLHHHLSGTLGRTYYLRNAFRFDNARPPSNVPIQEVYSDANGTLLQTALTSAGKVNLWSNFKGLNLATSGSIALQALLWYYIDLKVRVPSSGNATTAIRVLGADENVIFESGDVAADLGNQPVTYLSAGHGWGGGAGAIWVDEFSINDDLGSASNSWPARFVEGRCLWGALPAGDHYDPTWEKAPYDLRTWDRFEQDAGRSAGIIHAGDPWVIWDGFGEGSSEAIRRRGGKPLKSLGTSSPAQLAEVIAGDWDEQIDAWARAAKRFGSVVYLRPWWEMNGTWFSWGRSEHYVAAWRHLYGRVKAIARSVEFVWCTNTIWGDPKSDPAPWYPGDEYVEWVGFDAYTGRNPYKDLGWFSPNALFLPTYDRLRQIAPSKPVMICESGVSEYGGDKARWLTDLLGSTLPFNMPAVDAFVYFNWEIEEDGGKMDWPIESSPEAQAAFARAIASPFYRGGERKRVVVAREHPPSKLAVRIEAPDGTPLGRWAEDEGKVENVLANFTKDGDMPGGHKDSGCVLARDPKQSHPDLALFSTYKVEGAGGEILWQGTLRQQPQSDGYHIAIEPKAVGDRQFLEDDEAAVGPGFINRDLSAWTGPGVARRIELDKVNAPNQADPQVVPNPNGFPALQLEVSGRWEAPVLPRSEAFFTALNGTTIGRLLGVFEGVGDARWMLDTWVGSEHVGDLYAGAGGVIDYTPATPQASVAFTWTFNATPEGADGHQWPLRLQNLIVLGPQGLALQGTWPHVGFTAKQMIPFIAALGGLATKDELLEDDGFVIPQAWFSDPATPMSKLVEVTKYGLLDLFVFNDRILQYRVPGAYGRKWRLDSGSAPKNSGPDAERVWDRIRVTWQDVDGTAKSAVVGPVTDPRNPAVAAGRPRRKLLALNGVCTEELAAETAIRFLEEAQQLDQSGSATLTGYVQEHSSGVWYPTAYVQPGDWVVEPATGLERKITSAPYSHDAKSVGVTLGGPPEGLGALEERFNAKLIELGL